MKLLLSSGFRETFKYKEIENQPVTNLPKKPQTEICGCIWLLDLGTNQGPTD